MPFCHVTLNAPKPPPEGYPVEVKTIGDHIVKERLDRGLLQHEVAVQVGVDLTTVRNWERGRTEPALRHWPALIRFLGYDPLPRPKSFPERLRRYRLRNGLSRVALAERLGVDPTTVWRWESGRGRPTPKLLSRVEETLGASKPGRTKG